VLKTVKTTYWGNIKDAISTLSTGLKLTLSHLFSPGKKPKATQAIWEKDYFSAGSDNFTLQYPKETIPVPENGRYKLHNEIEDCIVCDKCAKVCPVDCIEIEAIKSPEEIGRTSDDTPKRLYAAKFDIDMSKCCFCGLCTTVCPTECLTMTDEYDFSAFDFKEHNFAFAEMTPLEILEKKKAWEKHQEAKVHEKQAAESTPSTAKPAFKPKMPMVKPIGSIPDIKQDESQTESNPKPVFRPKVPMPKPDANLEEDGKPESKPLFKPRPMIRKKPDEGKEGES
jgi:formate hydrogenlyase subunit 6/NADH:ubiquinone oxidoreductase subunit I